MKPHKGRIDNWAFGSGHHPEPYDGQEHLNLVVRGIPVGHPNFVDFIRTSLVVKFDEEKMQIETLNSIYDLGTKAQPLPILGKKEKIE